MAKSKTAYQIEYHWSRSPEVWATLVKVAVFCFIFGVIVGAYLS